MTETVQIQKLSPVILDEVWTLMNFATGAKDDGISSDDDFVKAMPDHFQWECTIDAGEPASDDDSLTKSDNGVELKRQSNPQPSQLTDKPTLKKDDSIHDAADLLAEMGDKYCEQKQDEAKLIEDITQYLMRISKDIDERIDQQLGSTRPPEEIFKSGILSMAYTTFQSKLQGFLGLSEGVEKIAFVTHVAKGVASGLKDSNLPAVHLVSALAYKLVSEKYQNVLEQHGSVTKLVKSTEKFSKEPHSTD